ncbi:hypothetical protein [Paenibacillus lutrae]|uniref:Uncharacterized protein n=1 Tax=Paenibacillus lutrae TaxID=2078573 RepID=A0A7X3K0I9_9BACL|nr:hypothetical protein [Paenibacillus lutrae]MVP01135.1 hypothetical protein [Paenibacillus lutrae]
MDKKEQKTVEVFFHATISYLVRSANRSHAMEAAQAQLNESCIQLGQLRLVNEQGMAKWFQVEKLEELEWTEAQDMRDSNRYKVSGQVKLRLSLQTTDKVEKELKMNSFRLPKSMIHDHTVWVIPTISHPAFVSVTSQSLHVIPAVEKVAVYSKVG